jgi:hypothetical protein
LADKFSNLRNTVPARIIKCRFGEQFAGNFAFDFEQSCPI